MVLAAWVLALVSPSAVVAQGRVVSASMTADLTQGDGPARVSLEYRLVGVEPARGVPVSVLGLGGSDVEEVSVEGRRVPLPITRGRYREGVLPATPAAASERALRVSYSVLHPAEGTRSLIVHLPVVNVGFPPLNASPGTFRVEVRVPPGWRLLESFPTGLTPTSRGTLAGELPVLPSVVTLRVRVGPGGGPGLPLLLDLLAGTVIVGFSVVGWRFMRRAAT